MPASIPGDNWFLAHGFVWKSSEQFSCGGAYISEIYLAFEGRDYGKATCEVVPVWMGHLGYKYEVRVVFPVGSKFKRKELKDKIYGFNYFMAWWHDSKLGLSRILDMCLDHYGVHKEKTR